MKTNQPSGAQAPIFSALVNGEIKLGDTTSRLEAASVRVIDALPAKVQTIDFLSGGYCVAKCYGPNREEFARLFVAAPDLLKELLWAQAMLSVLSDHVLSGSRASYDQGLAAIAAAIAAATKGKQ